jgi:hypothetical protein
MAAREAGDVGERRVPPAAISHREDGRGFRDAGPVTA